MPKCQVCLNELVVDDNGTIVDTVWDEAICYPHSPFDPYHTLAPPAPAEAVRLLSALKMIVRQGKRPRTDGRPIRQLNSLDTAVAKAAARRLRGTN